MDDKKEDIDTAVENKLRGFLNSLNAYEYVEPKKYSVYELINQEHRLVYVGSSHSVSNRFMAHAHQAKHGTKRGSERRVFQALAKHGIESFWLELIATGLSQEEAKRLEDDRINQVINKLPGWTCLNMQRKTIVRAPMSTESRLKMSASKAKVTTEEVSKILCLIESTDLPQHEIGRMFNVSGSTVSRINQGKHWIQRSTNGGAK